MSELYKLYGAPLSLYTGKARAYLRYKQIPFTEVFSSRKVYTNIIVPKTGIRFIPVVETPQGEFVQDTSAIIDLLENTFTERSVRPTTPKQELVSAIVEMWADEWLLLPAMHYRWNHDNFPFIYEEFGKIAFPNMPAFIRRFVGKKLGAKFKGFVPLLGISDKTIPAIENWYEGDVLPALNAHFAEHDYLLGSRACVGDFGLMGPLYAHLFRDPAPGKIMQQNAPNVVAWINRMNSEKQDCGMWLDDDHIPDTLLSLLKRQFKEFWPVQIDTLNFNKQWLESHPEKSVLPRMVGKHSFTIGEATDTRAVRSFSQWKLQRVLDIYQGFDDTEKASVDPFLSSLDALELMQTKVVHRLCRINNVLQLEKA